MFQHRPMSAMTKNNIMGSTLKISTSSRGVHGVPVIKIIQPLSLIDPPIHMDVELKDELIASFLQTPCMAHPNSLFRVDTRWTAEEEKVRITTISAIEEGQVFHTFKHAILDRLISYDNLVEINEFEKSNARINDCGPVPFDYDKYLQIKQFFDWVWEQPYNGDPVNTPIQTRRDTVIKTKIPLETIRDYFELSLEQGERMNAFENTPKSILDNRVSNASEAFAEAFDINKSPQGAEYWQKIINQIEG